MRLFFAIMFLLGTSVAFAQVEERKDTLVVSAVSSAIDSLVAVEKDTIKTELVALPSNLEFIPADDEPELIADRLGCLQQTIPLT